MSDSLSTRTEPRDPWSRAPVGELQEQLLPRWFVLLGVVMVPVAAVVLVLALLAGSAGDALPVAERRPPPAQGLTHEVGELVVADSPAVRYEAACPQLAGIRLGGQDVDRAVLARAVDGLCTLSLDSELGRRLAGFAEHSGVLRFAVFEHTGVDSVGQWEGPDGEPRVLVNAKFTRADPLMIVPLVAHDVTLLDQTPGSAEGALRARQVEHGVCQAVLRGRRPSRACEDAAELLALPDPVAALRAAGYR